MSLIHFGTWLAWVRYLMTYREPPMYSMLVVILAFLVGCIFLAHTIELLFGRRKRTAASATPGGRVMLEETVAPDGTITRRIVAEDLPQAVTPRLHPLEKAFIVHSVLGHGHRDEMRHGAQWKPQDWN